MTKKSLGRSSGSLNAPIAAFTMAVVLCSYCIYSINSARRESTIHAHSQAQAELASATVTASGQRRARPAQDEWVKRALEERDGKGE